MTALGFGLVDEILVEVEQPAQDANDDQRVLLAMRQLVGALCGVVESGVDVGEVVAQRDHASPRDVLAHETPGGFDFTGEGCQPWMSDVGFRETYVQHLVGPDSMVVGIK